MTEIIHYTDPMSRGIRTQKILDVFDIPHQTELIDIRDGSNQKPEYLKVNPHGTVPALKHGDNTIIESGAIVLYLADLFAEKMNTPAPGTPQRARFYEWLMFFYSTMELVMVPTMGQEDKSEAKAKVEKLLTAMAPRFVGPYALGDQFSVVDVVLNVDLSWARMLGLFPEGLEPYASFLELTASRLNWEVPAEV